MTTTSERPIRATHTHQLNLLTLSEYNQHLYIIFNKTPLLRFFFINYYIYVDFINSAYADINIYFVTSVTIINPLALLQL